MVHRDKTGAAPLGTGNKLENTVQETTMNPVKSSVMKFGAPQAESKLHDIQRTITDTLSITTNTEITIKAILDELATLKGERERELERMRKDAQDDRKNLEQDILASLTTMESEQQKLIVERGELKREKAGLLLLLNKEKATLQCELESALTSLRAGKAKCDILIANTLLERKKVEEQLSSVIGEKDVITLALAQEKAKLLQKCDDMVKMASSIHNLKSDKGKLADQLSMTGKEVRDAKNQIMLQKVALEESLVDRTKLAEHLSDTEKDASEKKRKMEEAHKTALDKAQGDYRRLEHSNLELKRREQSMETKKRELENECVAIRQELLEEREKGLCQICVESPKDTICMPCLHFHYCSTCLEKHKVRSRTCPFCRTILSGTLKSEISMQS